MRRTILAALVSGLLLIRPSVLAAGFDEGVAAYDANEFKTALVEFRAAAEAGDSRAMSYVGWILAVGLTGEQFVEDGIGWMERGVELDDPKAIYDYGGWLFTGRFVPIDREKGLQYVRRAAEADYLKAQGMMGGLYLMAVMTGGTPPVSGEESLHWTRIAAQRGHPEALNGMGFMYHNGILLEKDPAEAIEWYRRAAEKGYIMSITNLVIMYWDGTGVDADAIESYKWFLIASRAGHDFARDQADQVATVLSAEQIEEARTRADAWAAALEQGEVAPGGTVPGAGTATGQPKPAPSAEAPQGESGETPTRPVRRSRSR